MFFEYQDINKFLTKINKMLEQLMGLIQDHSQDAIVNNPAIPNEHNNDAMQTILGAITGGMAQQAQGGGDMLGGLTSLLGGQAGTNGSNLMSNPIVAGITQNAVKALMSKFGIENSAASGIVAQVLPGVIGSMISKTNDPNDSSLDLGSILGALTGGGQQQQQAGGLGSLLGGLGSLLGGK